jgi:hypothetical protein
VNLSRPKLAVPDGINSSAPAVAFKSLPAPPAEDSKPTAKLKMAPAAPENPSVKKTGEIAGKSAPLKATKKKPTEKKGAPKDVSKKDLASAKRTLPSTTDNTKMTEPNSKRKAPITTSETGVENESPIKQDKAPSKKKTKPPVPTTATRRSTRLRNKA